LFVFCSFSYNISYLSRYITSYNSTSFTMSMWSNHQWFGDPFIMLLVWEWAHYNPWYISKYSCSYRVKEWNSCKERSFPLFFLPYTKTNGYCHHQTQALNLDKYYHCRSNSYKFGAVNFNNDNACNNNCGSRQGTILHKVNANNDFIPLTIKTYGCFHPHLVIFLCTC
jgi:hypothetical protein